MKGKLSKIVQEFSRKNTGWMIASVSLTTMLFPLELIGLSHISSHLYLELAHYKDHPESSIHEFHILLGLFVLLYVVIECITAAREFVDSKIIPAFYRHIRRRLVEFVFVQKNSTTLPVGEYLSRVMSSPYHAYYYYMVAFKYVVPFILMMISILIYFAILQKSFALWIFPGFLFYTIVVMAATYLCMKYARDGTQREVKISQNVEDVLDQSNLIVQSDTVQEELERLELFLDHHEKSSAREYRIVTSVKLCSAFLGAGLTVFVGYAAVRFFSRKLLSATNFVAIMTVMLFFCRSLIASAKRIMDYVGLSGSLQDHERFFQSIIYTDSTTGATTPETRKRFPSGPMTLFFNKVSYSYDHKQSILKDFSLKISSGESLLVLGPSGSGKTTLLKLLLGLLEPTEGTIFLANEPLHHYEWSDIRRHIVCLNQTTTLFQRSIYENIAYGKFETQPTRKQVLSVLESCAWIREHLFASHFQQGEEMNDFLNKDVGRHGQLLSGGQRQFLWFLRCFFRQDIRILLLDEPTSSLDRFTKGYLKEMLDLMARSDPPKMIICVSHDYDLADWFDKTVKMK